MTNASFGHVSSAMMAVYSHVRRKALDEAAQALEPESAEGTRPAPIDAARHATTERDGEDSGVMSQVRSPSAIT